MTSSEEPDDDTGTELPVADQEPVENGDAASPDPLNEDTNMDEDEEKEEEDSAKEEEDNNEEQEQPKQDEGEEDLRDFDDDGEEEEEEEDDDDDDEEMSSAAPPPRPKDPRSRKRRRRDKMFQDCLFIQIPLDLTADLGIAMRRTRRKRIEALTKDFPDLVPTAKADDAGDSKENPTDSIKGDTTMEAEDEENGERRKTDDRKADVNSPPRKNLTHVPRREDYANVVDYLEAKYTQGVMINDDEDEEEPQGETAVKGEADEDDEGQGSVYSQSSFLDDRGLQRDVAEQVLAQSTTTKLELESNNDDAFFVNVGNLEVEESFFTEEGYDPVNDSENVKKPKKKRKPAGPKEKKVTKGKAATEKEKEKKKPAAKAAKDKAATTKKKAADSTESPKKKAKPAAKSAAKKKPITPAEKEAAAKKKESDVAYKNVVEFIKAMPHEDLPRRKTKERVAITCPADKKPGDSILFANPHVPGQRLKVKIPKKTAPGGTFRVSVPVAPSPEDEEDNVDHNKWSRDFYDCFGEYCRLHDEWVDLMAVVKEEAGIKDYVVYFEKRNRFDQLVHDVPQDLKTPLDKAYMQKLLRRARQNRHKRERTLKRQEERAKELRTDQSDDNDDDDGKSLSAGEPQDKKVKEEEKEEAEHNEEASTTRTVLVPNLTTEFPTVEFNPDDF